MFGIEGIYPHKLVTLAVMVLAAIAAINLFAWLMSREERTRISAYRGACLIVVATTILLAFAGFVFLGLGNNWELSGSVEAYLTTRDGLTFPAVAVILLGAAALEFILGAVAVLAWIVIDIVVLFRDVIRYGD